MRQNFKPENRASHRRALIGQPADLAATIALEDGSEIFCLDGPRGFILAAFAGKAFRPTWHYRYSTALSRDAAAQSFAEQRRRHAAARAQRQADRRRPHSLAIGAVLVSSWGYEQTNVEFYEVIDVRGRNVVLRELAKNIEHTGYMTGTCTPQSGAYVGEPFVRRATHGNTVSISSFQPAQIHNGRPCSWSSYA